MKPDFLSLLRALVISSLISAISKESITLSVKNNKMQFLRNGIAIHTWFNVIFLKAWGLNSVQGICLWNPGDRSAYIQDRGCQMKQWAVIKQGVVCWSQNCLMAWCQGSWTVSFKASVFISVTLCCSLALLFLCLGLGSMFCRESLFLPRPLFSGLHNWACRS